RRLIDLALDARDWDRAARWLDQAARLDPADGETVFHAALLRAPVAPADAPVALAHAAADPEFATGVQAILVVLAEYGGAPRGELAFRLGLAMSNLGEWNYAERAFRAALETERANPAALAFLGLAQSHTGRDGWPPIRQALDLAPNDALVNYAAGVHWRLNEDAARALEALQTARTLDAHNPAIAAELGLAYQDAGQPSEALLYLTTATELAPDDPAFRRLLASFIADGGYDLTGQGLALLRRLAEHAPDDPDVLASLGWALLAARDVAAARDALNRAVTLDAENPRTRFYFAALLEMEGDLDGALDSYRFVASRPDAGGFIERARRAIERLAGG
ncbi:MAG: tetratricopeptide repeat protein, partial [Anaerolineae bacterium]|nr:tetratricopeptide repeat protein [Anaerolineae bacterium]